MPSRDETVSGLLVRMGEDDAGAVQELFEQQKAPLMRLFYGLTRCFTRAEDLVQSTFIALWRYRQNYKGRGSAHAYVYRVAVNQWRRENARERRSREAFREFAPTRETELVQDADDSLERAESRNEVWRAIDSLPEAQRETFVLHRFEEMSCPQIAQVLDKSVKTVESRLRLALEKLTEKLQKREHVEKRERLR